MVSMEEQQAAMEQQRGASLCEECNSEAFKYKCPACSRRTCSLPCVNSHKQNSGCTGKRNRTQFMPISQFDDSTLLSDYNLLEEVKRLAESSKRMRVKLCGYHPQFRIPFHLKALRSAAARKGSKLLFLPAGMLKREKNQTRYNQRKKSISWTIEWRFHSTDVVLLEHGVHESTTLRSVIGKHLQPSPWRNKLRKFCEEPLDNLKFFIRKYHKGTKSPYRELDLDAPVSQLVAGLVVLEYPVIHVFLPSDSYDFEVVKDARPPPTRPQPKVSNKDDSSSPVGILFKEEEIEEDESAPEPQIIDLLKSSEVDTQKTTSSTKDLPSSNPVRHITESDEVPLGTIGKEVEMLDAKVEDFDFDQDLIDAYTFLMEQSNPDDFLDYKLEGEGEYHENTNVYFANGEELEEGEIPNSD